MAEITTSVVIQRPVEVVYAFFLVPDARLAMRDCGTGNGRAEWVFTFTSLPEGTRVDFAQELALPSAAKTNPDLGDPAMNTIAQTFVGLFFNQLPQIITPMITARLLEDKRRLEAEALL